MEGYEGKVGGGVREGWREEWGHLVGGYPPDWRVRISEGRSVGAFGVGAGTGQSLAGIRRIKGWRGRGVGTSWQLGVVSEGVVRLFGVREGGGRGRFGALPYFDTKKRRGRGLRGGGAGGGGLGVVLRSGGGLVGCWVLGVFTLMGHTGQEGARAGKKGDFWGLGGGGRGRGGEGVRESGRGSEVGGGVKAGVSVS